MLGKLIGATSPRQFDMLESDEVRKLISVMLCACSCLTLFELAAGAAPATAPKAAAAAAAAASSTPPPTAASSKKEAEKLPMQQRILNSILNVSNVPYRLAAAVPARHAFFLLNSFSWFITITCRQMIVLHAQPHDAGMCHAVFTRQLCYSVRIRHVSVGVADPTAVY
jgi:hypothetical protein